MKQNKRSFRYQKTHAFTSANSAGNPAACIYLQDNEYISEQEMQQIAREHRGFVSEVVYCTPDKDGFTLKYYSSECEVEFCGHGTIACMYQWIKENAITASTIHAHTNKGDIMVMNRMEEADAVFISAPPPIDCAQDIAPQKLAAKLGLQLQLLHTKLPVCLIDAGLRTLIVPVATLEAVLAIYPDESDLKVFCLNNDIDILLVFSLETVNEKNSARTRVFAPKFGYLEDPATGSGSAAFGYYLHVQKLWSGQLICLEQNASRNRYNTVMLQNINGQVWFGGSATLKIDGMYFV
jgi:PhzF family phenazine biosynthesis protein